MSASAPVPKLSSSIGFSVETVAEERTGMNEKSEGDTSEGRDTGGTSTPASSTENQNHGDRASALTVAHVQEEGGQDMQSYASSNCTTASSSSGSSSPITLWRRLIVAARRK